MSHYTKSITALFTAFKTTEQGLSLSSVAAQQAAVGANELPKGSHKRTRALILFSQFTNILVIILIIAGVISGLLGEFTDMVVIGITVLINAVVGFFQEDKANQSLEKLSSLIQFHAVVMREGKKITIPSTELVPGDILFLEAGDKIQADGRIFERTDFFVDESSLTGESEPVKKTVSAISKVVGVGDRKNMVFKGTTVTNGHAKVLVTSIGIETEIGKIANLVSETEDEQTPLQRQLSRMSKIIGIVVVLISAGIFVAELLLNPGDLSVIELFELSVAIAIAAIPEGLVISLTIILAIGMSAILKKKALVRKLVAAETLGSVSVICTDKTGTITEGRMSVTHMLSPDKAYDQDEIGIITKGKRDRYPDVFDMLRVGVLANEGLVENKHGVDIFTGDSTDTAFLRIGMRLGLQRDRLEDSTPRIADIPFSSERKFVATLLDQGDRHEIAMKGAPEVILAQCTSMRVNGKKKKITKADRQSFQAAQESFAARGLRVIAVAVAYTDKQSLKETDISGATFLGLVALSDPIRSDVQATLETTKKAGIRTIMITGDHGTTAEAIGKEIGLLATKEQLIDGRSIETMSEATLQQVVQNAVIFFRVDPVHKIRIVAALQKNGEVVAMTGDGVNDAPAIKGADIGIALGSGTDVAKETADMVLLDDAYSTIVKAVEQGRRIYQNIRKIVLYLLSGSFAEMVLVIASLFAGLPLPILPAQILWMNIVEDVFPNLAIAYDKGDADNMSRPPRKKGDRIVDKRMLTFIFIRSLFENIALFVIFLYVLRTTGDIDLTRSVMFVGIGIDSLFYIFAVRSLRRMVWKIPVLSNKYFLPAIIFAFLMVIIPLYWAPLQVLLKVQPILLEHWQIMIGFGIFNLVIVEITKAVFIYYDKRRALLQANT